jgi:hypothetical protein
MTTEYFYPQWIEYNLINNNFIYNSERMNYRYKNSKFPQKAYKFRFDPIKDHPTIKRGDLICFTENGEPLIGYNFNNKGIWIWDGEQIWKLDTSIKQNGTIPSKFKIGKEFSPDHWYDKLDNNLVYLENNLYPLIKFYIRENNGIEGKINILDKNYTIIIIHDVDIVINHAIILLKEHMKTNPPFEIDPISQTMVLFYK